MNGDLFGRIANMPARSGCCHGTMNLQKMDPYSGAILWRKFINPYSVSLPLPRVVRIEPLHTTQNMLIGLQNSGTITQEYVCLVDSGGNLLWYTIGQIGYIYSAGSKITRMFGSDQYGNFTYCPTNVTMKTFAVGDDPRMATPLWAKTFTGVITGVIVQGTTILVAEASNISAAYADTMWEFDSATGSTNWRTQFAGSFGSGFSIQARDNTGTYFIPGAKRVNPNSNPMTFAEVSPGASGWNGSATGTVASYGPGGYVGFDDTAAKIIGTNGNTITPTFKTNSWIGTPYTLASVSVQDTCSMYTSMAESPYYGVLDFFVGGAWGTSGVSEFSIAATDGYGTVIWMQELSTNYPGTNHSAIAIGCNLSDDGYLYVGGGVGTY